MVAVWTSVNERLPEYGTRVMIWYEGRASFGTLYEVCVVCHKADHFVSDGHHQCVSVDVVGHWSICPKAPYTPIKKIRVTTQKRKKINKTWNSNLF